MILNMILFFGLATSVRYATIGIKKKVIKVIKSRTRLCIIRSNVFLQTL